MAAVSTRPELSPSRAKTFLKTFLPADTPIVLWSAPGIGKSSIARQVCRELYGEDGVYADIRAGQIDGTLVRGLPVMPKASKDGVGRAHFAPLAMFPDRGPGLICLDELDKAEIETQNALLELLLDGRLGEYRKPRDVHIVACCNRVLDRAGSNRLTTALKSRCAHIHLALSLDDWMAWAVQADVHPLVCAFVETCPEHLHVFNPEDAEAESFPCPRTWEKTSDMLKLCQDDDLLYAMVSSNVGSNASASKFTAFAKWYFKLPRKEEVLKDPDGVRLPEEGSTRWCLAVALIDWLKGAPAETQDGLIRVALRLTPELTTFFMVHLIARFPGAFKNRRVMKWATENQAALNRRRVKAAQ